MSQLTVDPADDFTCINSSDFADVAVGGFAGRVRWCSAGCCIDKPGIKFGLISGSLGAGVSIFTSCDSAAVASVLITVVPVPRFAATGCSGFTFALTAAGNSSGGCACANGDICCIFTIPVIPASSNVMRCLTTGCPNFTSVGTAGVVVSASDSIIKASFCVFCGVDALVACGFSNILVSPGVALAEYSGFTKVAVFGADGTGNKDDGAEPAVMVSSTGAQPLPGIKTAFIFSSPADIPTCGSDNLSGETYAKTCRLESASDEIFIPV